MALYIGDACRRWSREEETVDDGAGAVACGVTTTTGLDG